MTLTRKNSAFILTSLLLIALLSACDKSNTPVKGFVLPPGDVELGKTAFMGFGCVQCHTVAGSDVERPDITQFNIQLGGETRRVRHYGDLLTSIINPNHEVSPAYRVRDETGKSFSSPMPNFTNEMTVAQMIDLAEFLHQSYSKNQDQYSGYSYYYGP